MGLDVRLSLLHDGFLVAGVGFLMVKCSMGGLLLGLWSIPGTGAWSL